MKFHWGTAIILFFVLFIGLCISFMVFAFRQNQDLVEDDYYEKGAGYTKQMEINKRSFIYQDSLGLSLMDSSVIFNASKTLTEKIKAINVYFFRPSNKLEDYRTVIKPGQSMSVAKTKLSQGRYIVKLSWVNDQDVYMLEKEINIK